MSSYVTLEEGLEARCAGEPWDGFAIGDGLPIESNGATESQFETYARPLAASPAAMIELSHEHERGGCRRRRSAPWPRRLIPCAMTWDSCAGDA